MGKRVEGDRTNLIAAPSITSGVVGEIIVPTKKTFRSTNRLAWSFTFVLCMMGRTILI